MTEHYHYAGGGNACTNPECPDWLPKTRGEADAIGAQAQVLEDSAAARAERRIRDDVNFGLTRGFPPLPSPQPYTLEEAIDKLKRFYKTYPMLKKASVQDQPKCPNCGAIIYDGLRCSGCGQRT